ISTTQQEEVLVIGRSTDTLTILASTGRGYNSTTATTWTATDYFRLNVTAPVHERLKDVIAEIAKQVSTNTGTIATNSSDLASTSTGKGAALVGIEDAGGYYAGSTTESA